MLMNEYSQIIRKKFKSNLGFTLIELMVVVVILSFVVLGLVTIFSGGVRSYISGNAQLEAQRNARQAMDRMVRELRHGKKIVPGQDSKSVTVQIPTIKNEPAYEVTYFWFGDKHGPLYREVSGARTPVIDNVLNLEFDSSTTSRIKIRLEVDFDKDSNPDISLNTAVTLRNF
jgi:prepilin-type N-terminal cleavage/methylation domain-containing protein